MEPRLNIKISQIFEAAEGGEDEEPGAGLFIPPGVDWPFGGTSNKSDLESNALAVMEMREGIGAHLDENPQNMGFSGTPNPAQDRALMVLEEEVVGTPDLGELNVPVQLQRAANKIQKQASGFNTVQAREDFTMGVVANINNGTLVSSRVVVETPNTKVAGTVLAVGDSEFAVVWDDRTASVERKADYELVFAE